MSKAYSPIFPETKGIKFVKNQKTFCALDIIGIIIAVGAISTIIGFLVFQQNNLTYTSSNFILNLGRVKEINIQCQYANICTIITNYTYPPCASQIPYNNITIHQNQTTTVKICGTPNQDDGPILVMAIPSNPSIPIDDIAKLAVLILSETVQDYVPVIQQSVIDNIVISETIIKDITKKETKIIKYTQNYNPKAYPGISCQLMGFNPYVFSQTECGIKRFILDNADTELETVKKMTLTNLISQILASFVIWSIIKLGIVWLRKLINNCQGIDSSNDNFAHQLENHNTSKKDLELGFIVDDNPDYSRNNQNTNIQQPAIERIKEKDKKDFRRGGFISGSKSAPPSNISIKESHQLANNKPKIKRSKTRVHPFNHRMES